MDQSIFLPWLQRHQLKEHQYQQLQADQINVTIAQKVLFVTFSGNSPFLDFSNVYILKIRFLLQNTIFRIARKWVCVPTVTISELENGHFKFGSLKFLEMNFESISKVKSTYGTKTLILI